MSIILIYAWIAVAFIFTQLDTTSIFVINSISTITLFVFCIVELRQCAGCYSITILKFEENTHRGLKSFKYVSKV